QPLLRRWPQPGRTACPDRFARPSKFMKEAVPSFTRFGGIAILVFFTAFTSVSTTTTPALGVPVQTPTDPAHVQILMPPPTRPHLRLGEVQAQPPSTSTPAANIEVAL